MSTAAAPRSRAVYSFVAGCAVGLFVATVGFALVLRNAAGSGAATSMARTLTLAHSLDPSHPVHQAMEYMARRVEELSNGRLRITIYHSGQLGAETDCLEQLQAGSLDITKVSTSPLESFVPEMAVFSMPYVFRDGEHFWRVLQSPLGQRLLQAGQNANVHGLCYYDAGARSYYTVDRPVLSPADLRGMKIRVQKSKTAMDMVQAMGGLPTPIAWGELYSALQQRMVDGAENNPPSLYTSRHYEVARHYALDEHTRTPDIVLIAQSTWKSLDPAQQRILQQAADESSRFQRELWKQKTAESIQAMEKLGVKIYQVDKQPFMQAVEPMLRGYDGTPMGRLIEEIRAIP
ncbi:TRAP transporter substrate-binding protein [Fontivita pretiosa]|uniref:TRAP transporter substrate-binding protein n=1 Tax=Fontivita pretiosa TaxID=2989684 RepID=UPI003D167076